MELLVTNLFKKRRLVFIFGISIFLSFSSPSYSLSFFFKYANALLLKYCFTTFTKSKSNILLRPKLDYPDIEHPIIRILFDRYILVIEIVILVIDIIESLQNNT